MKQRLLQIAAALALFWLFWQGIDQVSQFLFTISSILDVLVSPVLILIAVVTAWNLGGFLSKKILERYARRRGLSQY